MNDDPKIFPATRVCKRCGRRLDTVKDYYSPHTHVCKDCVKAKKKADYAETHPQNARLVTDSAGKIWHRQGVRRRYYWTVDMLERLRTAFPTAKNEDLSLALNVSRRTLIRKARELGLEKDPEWIREHTQEACEMMIQKNRTTRNSGMIKPGEHRNPAGEFKKGNVPPAKKKKQAKEKQAGEAAAKAKAEAPAKAEAEKKQAPNQAAKEQPAKGGARGNAQAIDSSGRLPAPQKKETQPSQPSAQGVGAGSESEARQAPKETPRPRVNPEAHCVGKPGKGLNMSDYCKTCARYQRFRALLETGALTRYQPWVPPGDIKKNACPNYQPTAAPAKKAKDKQPA